MRARRRPVPRTVIRRILREAGCGAHRPNGQQKYRFFRKRRIGDSSEPGAPTDDYLY
jgi:hypothetical protein